MSIRTRTKILIGAAVLLAAILAWVGMAGGIWQADPVPVSVAQFDGLTGKPTYDEVAAALGSPGVRQPDTQSGGIVYAWPLDNGTTGRIIFVDGKATWVSRPQRP